MLGRNKTSPVQHEGNGLSLKVVEVFKTIQGECLFTGHAATFIRLQGCNLRCSFCDTEFEHGTEVSLPTLLELVHENIKLVVLTGGEPMLQNIAPLCAELLNKGHIVQIETAGTVCPRDLEPLLPHPNMHIVCSPKTMRIHPAIVNSCYDFKYVISAGEVSVADGLPICICQGADFVPLEVARPPSHARVWVQPCDAHDEASNQANLEAALSSVFKFGYRLSAQVHKLINMP